MPFFVRPLQEEDATAAEALLQEAFAGFEDEFPGSDHALVEGVLLLAQTGHRLLVACDGEEVVGAVRWRNEEGIAWFDLLVAGRTGAGRELVRAVEHAAQDGGLRLVRLRVPEGTVLEDYFARFGYLPIGREAPAGAKPQLVLEKRLPLLTVREQRRADAAAIGALTGEDPWVYEQGARPGCFVAADGDRVCGFVSVRDGGAGAAAIREPVLLKSYRGRGLEVWMIERAVTWAETNGYHSAALPTAPSLERLTRALEDRRWFREGAEFVRRFAGRALEREQLDRDWD